MAHYGRAISTIHTWPGANGIVWPDPVVNVVPPSADGRDQRAWKALPLRSTTAVPLPVVSAYGGRRPCSRNLDVLTVVYWITTVAADSWGPSVLAALRPSIDTSQRPAGADHLNVNEADE